MGAAENFQTSRKVTNEPESGSLLDIWDNGYFWRGTFTPGADNRLMLARVIDKLISVSLQMAEKRTAANDLEFYYTHVTGEEVPKAERDRLKAWVSNGYDIQNYPILSELELSLQRNREKTNYNDAVDMLTEVTGRREGGMVIFSEDDVYGNK